MAIGPGKYDDLCTAARAAALADGALLMIVNGVVGSGFSVQAPFEVLATLPETLERVAADIRSSTGAVSPVAAFAQVMLTIGRAHGAIKQTDARRAIVEALQQQQSPVGQYLTALRDELNTLLES